MKAGDHVDELGDDSGHDKGVGAAGDDEGDLNVQLLPGVVQPATHGGARVDAIQSDDIACSEEGVEKESDNAADSVLGEDIQGIIDADEELD